MSLRLGTSLRGSKRARRRWAALAGAGAVGLVATIARADTQAIDVTTVGTYPPLTNNGFNYYQPPGNYTFSWDFTANSPIQVTQLGYYNSALAGTPEPDGFGSHLVTLFDVSTDSTLARVVVTSDNAATGVFNYAPVTPVTLNTTDTYQISGAMTDQYYLVGLNQAAAPTASQINYQFTPQDIFGQTGPSGTYSDFGPNFQFQASSSCTENVAGRNVIALSGDVCHAAPGAYNPTTTSVSLPVTYNGFGFYAHGGTIDSAGTISITTSDPNGTGGRHAVWADGAGSQINLSGSSTLTTVGANSYGVYATGGGQVGATGPLNASTSGTYAQAIYASGAGSQVTATGGGVISVSGLNADAVQADNGGQVYLGAYGVTTTVTTSGQGDFGLYATGANSYLSATNVNIGSDVAVANPVVADQGAAINMYGGSVATTGRFAVNATAYNASTINLYSTTLTASGAGAETLWATGGGTINANGVSITSSGGYDATSGSYAGGASNNGSSTLGTGGTLSLTSSSVSVTGAGGYGVYTADGGVTTLTSTNVSVTAGGVGVESGVGGKTIIAGGSVTAQGANALGLWASGTSASITTQVQQSDGEDIAPHAQNDGGVVVSTTGANATGARADSGGSITLNGGQVTTSGADAIGIFATGASSTVVASNVAVSTSGNLYAQAVLASLGGEVTMTGGSAQTSGQGSFVVAVLPGGIVNATGTSLTATGLGSGGVAVNGSTAAFTGKNLTINVTGGYDATDNIGAVGVANQSYQSYAGGGTVKLTNVGIVVGGAGGIGVFNADAGVATITGGSITTTGDDAAAVDTESVGQTTLTNVGLSTGGAGSNGLTVNGTSSVLNGAGLTISISGANSYGALASGGGALSMQGGTVSTSGTGAWGLTASGVGSQLSTTGVKVTTTGGGDASGNVALGAFARDGAAMVLTNTTFVTSGASAHGVEAGGAASVTISGGSVTTSGDNAFGLFVTDAKSTINASNGLTVTTSGRFADGVVVLSGASATLTGGSFGTTGAAAPGLTVDGAGSLLTATGVVVTTSGDFDANTGYQAQGVVAADSGAATLTNDQISTTGAQAHGVAAVSGGQITLSGGGVMVSGVDADSLLASGKGSTITTSGGLVVTSTATSSAFTIEGARADLGGALALAATKISTSGAGVSGVGVETAASAQLNGLTIATTGEAAHAVTVTGAGSNAALLGLNTLGTTGNGAIGLFAGLGATVTAGGVLGITTSGTNALSTGLSSFGVNADGAGSSITLNSANVSTSGVGAVGLLASDVHASGTGGVITVNGSLNVTTEANFAYDAFASGTGSQITLNGATTMSVGAGAFGLYATDGGVISAAGLTITDAHAGFGGGVEADSGSRVTLAGASSITLQSTDLVGLFATGTGLIVVKAALTIEAGDNPGIVAQSGTVQLAGATVTTTGVGNYGVAAVSGGAVTATGALNVTTTGENAFGLYASGASSSIKATNVAIATSGVSATAVAASSGGALTLGGGTIATTGAGAYAAIATGGGFFSLTGATVTTKGDGSAGLGVNGAGSELDAANVTVSTAGGSESASGLHAYGVYNGPNGDFAGGGVAKLSNVSVSTGGAGMYGVYTGAGGVTTFTDGSVMTSGVGAHGLYASGGGSLGVVGVAVSTSGAGAFGAYASGGGALTLGPLTQISTSGANANALVASGAGSQVMADGQGSSGSSGTVSFAATGANAAAISADSGGAVMLGGQVKLTSAYDGIDVIGGTGAAASVTAPGSVSLTTTAAGGAAVKLSGDGATFSGTGGGTINSAGVGIALLNGVNQVATFNNYTINSLSGDLVFADPSDSTVNFNNTSANAGAGNLVNATSGSDVTLNAIASNLIGAIQTDATSSTNVNLSNGSTWTISANSTATNLTLSNSMAAFAPSSNGVFKTLTVTNYSGTDANFLFNAVLSGPALGADQLVVNGGKATGTTVITVQPVAGNLSGAVGSKPTVAIVTTTNGGSIAPGAFTLSGPLAAGGYIYTLQGDGASEYLVGSQGLSAGQATSSLSSLAQSRESQAITSRVLGSILTGATEQVNCSACSSGFASFGSFALGMHGRWTLSPSLAVLAGGSYDSYSSHGVTVNNSFLLALAVRYDMVELGRYRPFFEAGVVVSPYANVSYRRSYETAAGPATSTGDTLSRSAAVYGRAGYIWRLTPRDEAAAYTDLTRSWQSTGGYIEGATGSSPFGALVLPSLDTMNIWKIGAQYTHLFGQHVEANVSAGFAEAFGANFGSSADISGFGGASGAAPSSFNWVELGGRLSYRFSKAVVGDAFVLGTLGAEPAGKQVHGGVALRMAF